MVVEQQNNQREQNQHTKPDEQRQQRQLEKDDDIRVFGQQAARTSQIKIQMLSPERVGTAPTSPVSSMVVPPVSPAMSTGGTQQKRRRKLARRRAYNRSHRRHRSSRNLFVSYADVNDSYLSMSMPTSSLHSSQPLQTTTTTTDSFSTSTSANTNSPKPLFNNDITYPCQFYNNDGQQDNQVNRDNNQRIKAQNAGNESGCEFVSEPEPEPEPDNDSSWSQKFDRFMYRPSSARRPVESSPSESFFLSNPFAQFRNNSTINVNKYLQLESHGPKQPKSPTNNSSNNKKQHAYTSNATKKPQQLATNSRHNQYLLHELNSSGSLDSTSTTSITSNVVKNASKRYQLAPTQSSHGLAATMAKSQNNSKTNTNFFSSLLGTRRRLEMSTSSNELVLPLTSACSAGGSSGGKESSQINCSSAMGLSHLHSSSTRGSSPAVLDKSKRLSKSSMRIIETSPSQQTNQKPNRYSFLTPTMSSSSSSNNNKSQQQQTIHDQAFQQKLGISSDLSESNLAPLPRTNCSLGDLCRTISLDAPPSSSYVLSELAISQLACIDNVHFSDLFHGSVNESASSINLQQSVSTDPRLYQDDVDIKFSRTLNSCRLPQIRYATKERLFERLTDLRFLSIDFLNTFLLTYRVFASGEEVLEALKNVHYNYDEYIARGQKNQQERVAAKLHEAEMKQQQQDFQDNLNNARQQREHSSDDQRLSCYCPKTSSNQAAYLSDHSTPTTPVTSCIPPNRTVSMSNSDRSPSRPTEEDAADSKAKAPEIPARSNVPSNGTPPHPNQLTLPSQLSIQKRRSTINALSPITGSTSSSLINLASQSRQTSRETNEFKNEAETPTLSAASPLASSNEHIADSELEHIDYRTDANNDGLESGPLATGACINRSQVGSQASDIGPVPDRHRVSVDSRLSVSPGTDRARSSSVSNQAEEYRGRLTLDIPNKSPSNRQNRAQSVSYVPQNLNQQLFHNQQQQQQPCEHWRITFRKHIARELADQQEDQRRLQLEEEAQQQNRQLQKQQQQQQKVNNKPRSSQSSENGSSFKLKLDLVPQADDNLDGEGNLESCLSEDTLNEDNCALGAGDLRQPVVPPTTPTSGNLPASYKIADIDDSSLCNGDNAPKQDPNMSDKDYQTSSEDEHVAISSDSSSSVSTGKKGTAANNLLSSSSSGDEEEEKHAVFLRVGETIAKPKNNKKEDSKRESQLNHKLRQMSLVKEIDLVSAPGPDSSGDDSALAVKLSQDSSTSSANSSEESSDGEELDNNKQRSPLAGDEAKACPKSGDDKQLMTSSSDIGYERLNPKKVDEQARESGQKGFKPDDLSPNRTTRSNSDRAGVASVANDAKNSSSLLGAAINSVQSKFRRSSVSAHFAPDSNAAKASSKGKPCNKSTTPPPSMPASDATPSNAAKNSANARLNSPRSSCQATMQGMNTAELIDYSNLQSSLTTSPVSRAGVVVSSRAPRLSTRRSSNASALSAFAVATAACDNSILTHARHQAQNSSSTSGSVLGQNKPATPYRANMNGNDNTASVSNSRASSRLSSSAGLDLGAGFYSSASINQSQLSLLPGQQQHQPSPSMMFGRQSVASNGHAGGSLIMSSPASGNVLMSGANVSGSNAPGRKRKSTSGGQAPVKSARSVATLRVLSVLRHWISKHSQDFVNDSNLSAMTQEFLRDLIDDPRLLSTEHKSAIQLHQMVERASQSRDQQIDLNILLASPTSPTKESIETLSALEIAEGMTFLDHKIFLAIRSEEFLSQAWMKPDKAIRAPHILLMTKRFNDLSRLVSSEIIRVQEMHRRVAVIEKWTNVAHICRVVHNFNGVLQICAAFTNSAVFRLKKTWDKISKTTRTTIDQLQTLVSTDSRFRNMRDAINRCDPPSIPYVGMYLTDLSFIEEGTPNFAPDGLLNFSKMRMIAHVIREIQHLQKGIYKIDISAKVANYLLDSSRHLTDDQMYRSSLAIEARSASSAASYSMQQQHQSTPISSTYQSNDANACNSNSTSNTSKVNGNTTASSNSSLTINSNNNKNAPTSPGRHQGKS